jgi:hypothetical protein
MTAKEYLGRAFRLNLRIDADIREVERLRELAFSVRSPDLSAEGIRTSRTSDRTADTVAKIVDLETVINAEVDRLVDLKTEIRQRINAMPDDILRLILQKRYLVFEKWERIAVDTDKDIRWVFRLHKKALKKFQKLYF